VAIRSSELRKLAIFERRADGTNEFGEPSGAWVEHVRARASLDPLEETQEVFQALQINAESSARIRCRYKTSLVELTTADRVLIDGVVYDIRAVIEPGTAHKEVHFLVDRHRE
jgi:SPP1 family predicted phage head-tail adaptor